MKSIRTLAFILTIILVLGAGWFFFPAEGITIGNQNLRFPSYAEDSKPAEKEVDVDDVLNKVTKSFEMTCSDNVLDSMRFFRSYLKENPNRIYLPNDDYTYFDPLFHQLEQAQSQGKTYRVMHYGDSQIEMDRISSVLRQNLQELFGGSGPNMVPAVQPVPTISVSQHASGLSRYAVYGDATNARASHNRYGVMAQFSQVVGGGTITFKGNAEIYAVLLDGDPGVAIDNISLRGCSGTIFTRMNESIVRQSFDLLNTRLIIMQFGGNRMPDIKTTKNITPYLAELEKQIQYMRRVAPEATLLFIGPADMGRRYNGKMDTWHGLPELNDSLRVMSLRNNVAYWDMFNVMGGQGSMAQWVKHKPALAGADHIHFTFNGAQEIGADLARSFTTYYDFYKLRQRVPSEKVIEFVNLDPTEDSIRTAGRIKLPIYNPYGIKRR